MLLLIACVGDGAVARCTLTLSLLLRLSLSLACAATTTGVPPTPAPTTRPAVSPDNLCATVPLVDANDQPVNDPESTFSHLCRPRGSAALASGGASGSGHHPVWVAPRLRG